MISIATIVSMAISSLIAIGFPVGLLIYFRKTQRISWKAIGVGALIWIVFSQVLEKLLHVYMLELNHTTADFLKTPIWYGLYGGLAAGLFEEVGRFVGFRFLLKRFRERKDAIAYGIGHGGVEALIIGAFAGVANIAYSLMINSGAFDMMVSTKLSVDQAQQLKHQFLSATPLLALLGGFERIPAVVSHIALSLIVFYGVKYGRKTYLLYAILLHTLLDATVGYMSVVKANVWLIEGINLLAGVIALVFILKSRTPSVGHDEAQSSTQTLS
ncbi:MAG: YhfC family intramembrane metalloprotease [Tumebacillaceae bacterium]